MNFVERQINKSNFTRQTMLKQKGTTFLVKTALRIVEDGPRDSRKLDKIYLFASLGRSIICVEYRIYKGNTHANHYPMWWQITWRKYNAMNKLLSSPFNLSLNSIGIDKFLTNRIWEKLAYLYTIKINAASWAVVINSILLSLLFFFILV
uniref:Uncharacterized protein n=2 Tax=Physcomitrium patens TaxID=3218 RepID=A0A7I4BB76_PHYPA